MKLPKTFVGFEFFMTDTFVIFFFFTFPNENEYKVKENTIERDKKSKSIIFSVSSKRSTAKLKML